jgi:hypothetical protein
VNIWRSLGAAIDLRRREYEQAFVGSNDQLHAQGVCFQKMNMMGINNINS